MLASVCRRLSLFAAVTAAAVPAALAQNVFLNAPGLIGPKKAPPPPPPRTRAAAVWPRLDPGAVLCRTADDLARHAANTIARASGGGTEAADCQVISQPTGIQIVSREGLGRTQVKLSAPDDQTGWTDVWLPDKAPPGR
jgi:hypothetical protein